MLMAFTRACTFSPLEKPASSKLSRVITDVSLGVPGGRYARGNVPLSKDPAFHSHSTTLRPVYRKLFLLYTHLYFWLQCIF